MLISGKLGAGKNQLAEYLRRCLHDDDWERVQDSFAKSLKDGCRKDFSLLATYLNNYAMALENLIASSYIKKSGFKRPHCPMSVM